MFLAEMYLPQGATLYLDCLQCCRCFMREVGSQKLAAYVIFRNVAARLVATLDAYDILLRGDTSGDIRLASGDTVFVATAERLVTIEGE